MCATGLALLGRVAAGLREEVYPGLVTPRTPYSPAVRMNSL